MGKVEVSPHHSQRTEAPGNVAITSTSCQFLRQWEIGPMAFVVADNEEQGAGVVSTPKSIFRCEYLKENIPLTSSSSPRGTPGGGWSFEPSNSTNIVEIRNGKPVCEALERSKAILKAIENRKPSHEAPQKTEVSSEGITRRKLICEALETSKAILEALEKKGNSQVTSPRGSSGSPAGHGNLHVPSRRPVCPYLLRGRDSASLSPSATSEVQRNNKSLKSPFKPTSDITLRDETTISTPTTTSEVKRKNGNISLSTGTPPAEGKQGRPIAFPPSSGRNTATPTPHRLRVKRTDDSTTPAVESRDKNLKYLVIGNISRAAYRMGGDVAPPRPREHEQRSLVGSRPSILQTSPDVTRGTRVPALTSSTISVPENQRKSETTLPPPELPDPGLLKKSLNPTSSNGLVCELLGGREKAAGPQEEREDLPSGDPPGHTTDGTRSKTVAGECISCTGLRRNSESSTSSVNLRSEPQSPESCNTSGYTNSARQHLKHGRRASDSPPGVGLGSYASSSHPVPARPPTTTIMTPADRMESKYRVNIVGNSQSGVRTCNDQFTTGSKRTRKPKSSQGSNYSAATHTGQYLEMINIDQNIPECKSFTENIKVLETLTEGSNGVLDSSDGDWFKITKDFDHQASFPDHLNSISAKLVRNGTVSPWVLSPGNTAASAHGVPSGYCREKFEIIGGKSEFSKSRTSVGINRRAPFIGTGARPMATYLRKFTESRPSSRQNNEEPMENREKNIINTRKENKKNIEILQSSDRGGEKEVSSPSSGKDKDDATTSLQHKVMTGRLLSTAGCGDHLSQEQHLRQPDSSRLPQPVAARMKNHLISTLETSKNFSNNALRVGSFYASRAGSSQQNGPVKREHSRLSHQLVGTREEDGKRSGNTWVPVVDGKRRPSALSSPTGEDSGRNYGDHSILYIPHHILWNTKKDSKTKLIFEEALYTAGTTSECLGGQENNLPGNCSLSRLSCVTPHSDDGEFSGSEALEKYDQNLVLSVSPSDSDTSRQNDLDLVPPSLAPPLSGDNY